MSDDEISPYKRKLSLAQQDRFNYFWIGTAVGHDLYVRVDGQGNWRAKIRNDTVATFWRDGWWQEPVQRPEGMTHEEFKEYVITLCTMGMATGD